ncbi:hypothetical protein Gbro_2492 [Gordonia bronchialis DSM 43247]|uniref:Uncharacterized protein n=1 Tax=Gordonia bronchialis (strain ATCC 25592 / DSM 43247 / BCRC 13721 / JCM 3198 / KCTC 3076 / NBRC 16047 / NCTC 10667) TaxID=526226 RepID=D0LDW0_GORB4|nr:hypothetical protein [Gordonia bronchialis]ACY21733.1 hypothetical protein Gbro_2492 [Gordonia bronchialis DSM 43247]MCC3324519.1 hypothetical protein [Gordonia bronchialis]QGS24657.1 hypothetical protein FOB84_11325 [Gordonia bronchialis]UAK39095.1 hypothetical protein K8O93_05045 [Gordonia bronchialis]STQ64621.1 Uncharacterised protein [Gordonia bronchialis]
MTPFSDDELAEFYREIEGRTATGRPRRRTGSRLEPAQPCPTPDKSAFGTHAAALDAIAYSRLHRPRAPQLRSYRCACGAWHITSSAPRPGFDEPGSSATARSGRVRRKGKKKR